MHKWMLHNNTCKECKTREYEWIKIYDIFWLGFYKRNVDHISYNKSIHLSHSRLYILNMTGHTYIFYIYPKESVLTNRFLREFDTSVSIIFKTMYFPTAKATILKYSNNQNVTSPYNE